MEKINKTNFQREKSWFYQILCNFKLGGEKDKGGGEPFWVWTGKRLYIFKKAADSVSKLMNLSKTKNKITQMF